MADKDLHSLIRLRKWDVDEKQRLLAVVLQQEEAVLARQAALEAEVAHEIAYAGKLPADQRGTLAAYLGRCDDNRARLAAVLAEIRNHIAHAQNELAEAYRRLKTFEVTQEQRDAEARAEERRIETIELDELGLELHRRKAG
jgi:flagellar export protein FliJ